MSNVNELSELLNEGENLLNIVLYHKIVSKNFIVQFS